ncbi:MAG: STAS domain-containing protein [Armatimonadota bacterium]
MNLTVTMQDDVTVVHIAVDHLDVINVGDFKSEIVKVLTDHMKVVLDCEQIRMIDSSGLGAIMYCVQTLHTHGSELKLAALSKGVSALFELVRMHRMVGTYSTVDEAVNAYKY